MSHSPKKDRSDFPSTLHESASVFQHAGIRPRDYVALFSGLLLIRFAEQEERERQAIAEFEGKEVQTRLPAAIKWAEIDFGWSSEAGTSPFTKEDLRRHLSERVWPALRQCSAADGLLRLVPKLLDVEEMHPVVVANAVRFAGRWAIDDEESRQGLAREYESLLEKLSSPEQISGQFATPPFLREFMVAIGDPKPGESVYDPCFGMGGVLVEAAHHLQAQARSGSPEVWEAMQRSVIAGVEENAFCALVAYVRLMLAGVKQPRLQCADALEMPNGTSGGATYDCIFADLPFGLRIERPVSSQYRIPSRSGETLFLQHILGALKPGGRAVVLVAQSLLFRLGAEARLREWLLTEFRVEAVVEMPFEMLKPYSRGVKCSLLVIQRQPPREDVLFVNDGDVAFILGQGMRTPTPSGLGEMEKFATELEKEIGIPVQISKTEDGKGTLTVTIPGAGRLLNLRYELLTLALRVRQGIAGTVEQVRAKLHRLMPPAEEVPSDDDMDFERMDENNRSLAGLIEHFLDASAAPAPPSRKNDLVPIRRLAKRNWELLEKEGGLDRLEDFVKRIQEALPETYTVRLGDCAEVFSGVSYTRKDSDEDFLIVKERGPEVKLVRVKDLMAADEADDGLPVLCFASKKFATQAGANIPESKFLRGMDLVVSTSGTIGKVALAGDDIERTVASNGLAVIRGKEPTLGHFIGRLLLTEPYQEWLGSQSTGSVVQHLRVSSLRDLPIPVVPHAAQLAVIRSGQLKRTEQSFLDVLSEKTGLSPWLNFLIERREMRALNREKGEEWRAETALPLLRRMLEAADELEKVSRVATSADAIARWFLHAKQQMWELVGQLAAAPSLMRYTMLRAWASRYTAAGSEHGKAVETIEREVRQATKSELLASGLQAIRRLDAALLELVETECREMLAAEKVTAGIQPSIIAAGRETEVTVTLINEGVLPLSNVSFGGTNFKTPSATVAANLLPGQPFRWTCHIGPKSAGTVPIEISWTAQRLDFSRGQGKLDLAVEVQTLREAASAPRLEQSPYVVGSPIDPTSKMFYGRGDVIEQIKRALRTEGPSTVILLEGNRRVGKSSLLKRIAASGLSPDWIPVYVNFQGFDGRNGQPGMATREIFYGIAKELVAAVARHAPAFRLPDIEGAIPSTEGMEQTAFFIKKLRPAFAGENPFECFRLIVEAVLEATGKRRVLLMLDEFDKLQEGIDNGLTSPQLPENLRNLFHSYDRVSGILTGSRTIRRLRQEYWSVLFGIGISIPIKGLDEAAARRLVTEPVEGQLVFAPAAVDYVVRACARQPFLIQGLCLSIFEICASSGERSVTVDLASKAAGIYAQDNEHFRTVWDHVQSNRRQYLVCLVDQLTEKPVDQRSPVTMGLLLDTLERRGVAYQADKTFRNDLDELVSFELLGTSGDQRQRTYHIEIPIFAEWLRRNVDSEAHRLEAVNEPE
jgi:hypothetical protein